MSGISKDKLVFDTAATLADNDNVGSFLRASDGTLLTHTDVSGKKALDVNVANSVTVEATDLDIRDLSATQDNVAISDGTNTLVVNADGSINVNADIDVVNGADKAEDSAHASGDIGSYVLAVRQDTLASDTSTDGDYQSFKTDSAGALWVRPSQLPAASAPNAAIATDAVSVGTTETALPASALANRKKMIVQNLGNKAIFLGPTGFAKAEGLRIAAGGNVELELGPDITLYAIADSGTSDVRVFEVA